MAEISVILEGPDDPVYLNQLLDAIDHGGGSIEQFSLIGLTVDGEARELDDPADPVF